MEKENKISVKEQQEQLAMAMLRSFEEFILCVFGTADNNTKMD